MSNKSHDKGLTFSNASSMHKPKKETQLKGMNYLRNNPT